MMLMDSRKIGKNRPFTFASLEDMDLLICDRTPPDDVLEAAAAVGTQIFTPEDHLTPDQREAVFKRILLEKN